MPQSKSLIYEAHFGDQGLISPDQNKNGSMKDGAKQSDQGVFLQ
jgi:hypothetical protein